MKSAQKELISLLHGKPKKVKDIYEDYIKYYPQRVLGRTEDNIKISLSKRLGVLRKKGIVEKIKGAKYRIKKNYTLGLLTPSILDIQSILEKTSINMVFYPGFMDKDSYNEEVDYFLFENNIGKKTEFGKDMTLIELLEYVFFEFKKEVLRNKYKQLLQELDS